MAVKKLLLFEDKIFLLLATLTLFLISTALFWNNTHRQYTVDLQWINPPVINAFGTCLMYYIAGFAITNRMPYASNILKSIGMICFSWLLLFMLNTAAFTTPFSTLRNDFFNHLDHRLGFHLLTILQWVQGHPTLQSILIQFYINILILALLLPLGLALTKQDNAVYLYYTSFMISLMTCFIIYYFVPTTSPAAVYPATYFSSSQINLLHYFQAEHTHQPIHFKMSSVIGFPSLHAVWTILSFYCLSQLRWLKFPSIILCIITLFSIISTGWHFLSDVIAGVIISGLSIALAKHILTEYKYH